MDNNHTLNLTASQLDEALNLALKSLPRDGSAAMTGALTIDRSGETLGKAQFFKHNATGTDYGTQVRDEDKDGNVAALVVRATSQKALFYPDGSASREILHTGNKPSGSYTGNGSATSRTIDVGGIGSVLHVRGYGNSGIVMPSGAIFVPYTGGAPVVFGNSEMAYANGKLTITSTNNAVNRSGETYTYEVL